MTAIAAVRQDENGLTRHLAADMELAEQLSIRYMEVHASDRMIRALQRRYPQGDGWGAVGVVIVLASLPFGAAGLVLGYCGGSVCKG